MKEEAHDPARVGLAHPCCTARATARRSDARAGAASPLTFRAAPAGATRALTDEGTTCCARIRQFGDAVGAYPRPQADGAPRTTSGASRAPAGGMATPALDILSPTAAAVRSREGYVVPRFVEVTAGTHGILTSLAVSPRDVVHRGQPIATLERLAPTGEAVRDRVTIEAPVTGLVTRCWAAVGDAVSGTWPVLSIASAQDVMVVVRFPSHDAARLRRGARASVLLRGAARAIVQGTIVSVVDALPPDGRGGEPGRRACVVVSLPAAPPAGIWPGSGARVDIR